MTGLPQLPCACASLRRAARAVSRLYDDRLRHTGLGPTQLKLLQVLTRRGEVAQTELGELLATDVTTLSRTLRPLKQSGWIRSRAGDDRRVVNWSITASGTRKLEAALPAWESVQSELRSRLGADRWKDLLSELTLVAEATATLQFSGSIAPPSTPQPPRKVRAR